jgi:hypothetical protein
LILSIAKAIIVKIYCFFSLNSNILFIMHRFSLRQMEYLVACIDRGSVAQAANAMNVAQPTISVAIANLEDHL